MDTKEKIMEENAIIPLSHTNSFIQIKRNSLCCPFLLSGLFRYLFFAAGKCGGDGFGGQWRAGGKTAFVFYVFCVADACQLCRLCGRHSCSPAQFFKVRAGHYVCPAYLYCGALWGFFAHLVILSGHRPRSIAYAVWQGSALVCMRFFTSFRMTMLCIN